MNKKFLSVILFSTLMIGSIGTFTACKDYDDDIDSLNGRVDAVEKGLADLKSEFSTLAYVKDVAFANGKLTVTKKDGTTSTYVIPDENTNTTYTIDVVQSGVNNNTVTITMTGSDGSKIEKTVTFTDTNTGSNFDPTQLKLDKATGNITYGGAATGVTLPAEHKASVVVYKDKGVVVGWEVDGTKLLISDALPITSFEYIPENILAEWGERVIVFTKNQYNPVAITADKVTEGTKTNYLPNEAIAKYHVNPSSATLSQLKDGGKATILHKTVNLVTKAAAEPVIWKKSTIEAGIVNVALEADPSLFATAANKLDEIALQFATNAGNSITTEYVGVINKPNKLVLRLTDKQVVAADAKDDKCHFALSKVDAVKQVATIGTDNKATAETNHLVQQITYSKAIAGINLAELVHSCNNADGRHIFFDYANYSNFKLTFETVAYKVNETPQEKYMSLDGSTFKAVNYGDVNESSIGKAPMVLAKLTDTYNNALIAAAYIKLLIVGDAAAPAEGDITINNPAIIGIGCNTPNHTWATNDQFMSTKVYTFSSNDKLTALSKEQFHTIYSFVANPAKYTNKGDWSVDEAIENTDGKSNHKVTFTLKNQPLASSEYYAYGVYQKTTDLATLSKVSNSNKYPEYLAIKYTVQVDAVNFTATAKEKIGNYWDGNNLDIYCNTPDDVAGAQIDQNLNTNFMSGKVDFDYSSSFDKTKYPSFIKENMNYKFIFSDKNSTRTVLGVDGKSYQLYLNTAKTKLYAELSTVKVPAQNDINLVASLTGTNNNDITYAKTTIAKNLLNIAKRGDANAFYAVMNIRYANECDQLVTVTNGEFNARFIRPVNVAGNPAKQFEDGNNAGACVLKLNELISFTDWRNDVNLNSFAKHLNYYKFYNVTKISLDTNKNVMTNLGQTDNAFVTIEKVFGVEGAKTLLIFDSKTVTPDGIKLPDYGTVTYKNKDAEVKKEFKLQIPLVISYTWGDIKETVTVVVTKTL